MLYSLPIQERTNVQQSANEGVGYGHRGLGERQEYLIKYHFGLAHSVIGGTGQW